MRFILGLLLVFMCSDVLARPAKVLTIVDAATTTGYKTAIIPAGEVKSFLCKGATTAGAGATVVNIYGAHDVLATTSYKLLGTISLTLGTTITNDAFASDTPFLYIIPRVVSISGTGAYVTCSIGVVND